MLGFNRFGTDIGAIARYWFGIRLCCEFRAANRGRVGRFYFREEAITATRNSFYKARTFCGVAEALADFADRSVEPVVEIQESVRRPEFLLKFLASYDLAGVLEQHRQDLEGLFLKPYPKAVPAQFAGPKIQLENPKKGAARGADGFLP